MHSILSGFAACEANMDMLTPVFLDTSARLTSSQLGTGIERNFPSVGE